MQLCQHKMLCDTWEWEQNTLASRKNIIKVKVHPLWGLQTISNNNNSNDFSFSEINCTNSSVLGVHAHTSHKPETPRKMFQCMLDSKLWIILRYSFILLGELICFSSVQMLCWVRAQSIWTNIYQIFHRIFQLCWEPDSLHPCMFLCQRWKWAYSLILWKITDLSDWNQEPKFKHISNSVLCLVCADNNQICIWIMQSFSSWWLSTEV